MSTTHPISITPPANVAKIEPDLPRSGAQITVDSLVRNGVDVVFGFPGGTVIPLYDELLERRNDVRHILVRHEQGAVHAAAGYARVTGKPGVAVATSGPGVSNLITGLMDAHLDSTPLVVLGGQVITSLIGKDAFQECDMIGMTNSVTKHNFQCRDVNDLAGMLDQAFHLATTGRPGPVYIDLPKDIQVNEAQVALTDGLDLPFYVDYRPVDRSGVHRAANLIRNARRPLVVAGQGVLLSNASSALREFTRERNLPVGTTILAKGAVDERDSRSLGCFGMHGRRVANYAIANCDVMLAVGCRFSDRVTGEPKSFAMGKQIIHMDIDPYEIGKNVPAHVEMNCDALEGITALQEALADVEGAWSKWTEELVRLHQVCDACIPDPPSAGFTPKHVMHALNEVIRPDDIVTTGVGQHQMYASHYLYRSNPRTFVTSGGAGTMGFGLPSAIGAAVGAPGVNVWAIDGDGSLQMTIQELGTLSKCGAKVIPVIVDNGYLGMVRQWQELYYDRRYSSVNLHGSPDFVKIAEAYGIEGRFADDIDSLMTALLHAREADHSVLIRVAVEQESNIEPMIPPGGKVTDFCGYCIKNPGHFFSEDES